jgi:DNA polymerase III delta prime subunit
MSKLYNSFLWVEKYRPQSVGDIILPSSLKRYFNKVVKEDKQIANIILFSSNPGSGKSSLSHAICKDLDTEYLYYNTSKDNSIDLLRNNITKFATSKTLDGKNKIVILDELGNHAISGLQDGLRADLELFHNTCRFIITTNYINRIIDPLKSRCELIDFNFTEKSIVDEMKPKIIKRLILILKNEKIEFTEEIISKIVDKYYPDIRYMIKVLQQYSKENAKIDENILKYESVDVELFDMIINKKFSSARKYIIERNYNPEALYRSFYDEMIPKLPKEIQGQVIILTADYLYRNGQVLDKEINLAAYIMEIISLL